MYKTTYLKSHIIISLVFCFLINCTACNSNTQESSYSSLITQYETIVNYLVNDNLEDALKVNVADCPDEEINAHWSNMLIDVNLWSEHTFSKSKDAFGYSLQDINNDKKDEMILLLRDNTVLAVFSEVDSKAVLMDAFWSRHRCAISNDGSLYILSSGGAEIWQYSVAKINDSGDSLLFALEFGREDKTYYLRNDGIEKTIDENEIDNLLKTYPMLSADAAKQITSEANLKFINAGDALNY